MLNLISKYKNSSWFWMILLAFSVLISLLFKIGGFLFYALLSVCFLVGFGLLKRQVEPKKASIVIGLLFGILLSPFLYKVFLEIVLKAEDATERGVNIIGFGFIVLMWTFIAISISKGFYKIAIKNERDIPQKYS